MTPAVLLLATLLLCGCAADWRSQAVLDLWESRSGAILLRVFEFGPGFQVAPPNPAHAEELARVQAHPQQPYRGDDATLEVY